MPSPISRPMPTIPTTSRLSLSAELDDLLDESRTADIAAEALAECERYERVLLAIIAAADEHASMVDQFGHDCDAGHDFATATVAALAELPQDPAGVDR